MSTDLSFLKSTAFESKLSSLWKEGKSDIMASFSELINNGNKILTECTPISIKQSLYTCAQLKLSPSPHFGAIYLIPHGKECNVYLSYKGMIEIALRNPRIKKIDVPTIVYEGEEILVKKGTNPEIVHNINPFHKHSNPVGVYAVAHLDNGSTIFDILTMEDINKAKANSKSSKSEYSPWNKFPEEMMKKTAIRRLFKYLPTNSDMENAIKVDNSTQNKFKTDDNVMDNVDYLIETLED